MIHILAIIGSIGKLIVTAGGVGVSYLYRRRRSVRSFYRSLHRMGISGDEAKILTAGYRDMVSLPGLRQLARRGKG